MHGAENCCSWCGPSVRPMADAAQTFAAQGDCNSAIRSAVQRGPRVCLTGDAERYLADPLAGDAELLGDGRVVAPASRRARIAALRAVDPPTLRSILPSMGFVIGGLRLAGSACAGSGALATRHRHACDFLLQV